MTTTREAGFSLSPVRAAVTLTRWRPRAEPRAPGPHLGVPPMPVTGRQKPVVNGKQNKFSFLTLDDSEGRFMQGTTKVVGKVTDDHGREFTGKVHVRSATELRL